MLEATIMVISWYWVCHIVEYWRRCHDIVSRQNQLHEIISNMSGTTVISKIRYIFNDNLCGTLIQGILSLASGTNLPSIFSWHENLYTTGNGSHIFSCEPISKTGYYLGVCHGWFHLHGQTRAARSKNRELQNEKILPIAGLELATPDSQV